MTIQALIFDLEQLSCPNQAKVSQRFFKTSPGTYGHGDKFYGIRNPELRAMAKKYAKMPIETVFNLLDHEYHETRLLAVFIMVSQFQKAKSEAVKSQITNLYIQNSFKFNNWDLVDSSAYKILGPALFYQSRDILYELAHSENLWQRRIAIISTMYFINNGEFDDTLQLCKCLLSDKQDLIHKACGWMLREVGKVDKSVEVQFLEQHAAAMPRKMLTYALEKFSPDERAYFRSLK